jgi:hypothetical protein
MTAEIAGGDALGGELYRWSEAVQLQLRMLGATVDRPLLKLLRDDLADARRAHALFSRDFVIGEALAQLGEDASPPEHQAMRAHPPAPNGRLVFSHCKSLLTRSDLRETWIE